MVQTSGIANVARRSPAAVLRFDDAAFLRQIAEGAAKAGHADIAKRLFEIAAAQMDTFQIAAALLASTPEGRISVPLAVMQRLPKFQVTMWPMDPSTGATVYEVHEHDEC